MAARPTFHPFKRAITVNPSAFGSSRTVNFHPFTPPVTATPCDVSECNPTVRSGGDSRSGGAASDRSSRASKSSLSFDPISDQTRGIKSKPVAGTSLVATGSANSGDRHARGCTGPASNSSVPVDHLADHVVDLDLVGDVDRHDESSALV